MSLRNYHDRDIFSFQHTTVIQKPVGGSNIMDCYFKKNYIYPRYALNRGWRGPRAGPDVMRTRKDTFSSVESHYDCSIVLNLLS